VSRLINTVTMTVDGVTDVGEWYVAEGGHDGASRAQFDGAAGMVVGRTTYEGLAAFWSQQTGEWADLLNPLPKFVASRTLRGPLEWNATVIEGDAAEGVARLKATHDEDLVLAGCGELARHLLAPGSRRRAPVLGPPRRVGRGRAAVQGEVVKMRFLDSTAFDSGVVLLRYEPAPRAGGA
jgi:dihydrofolate reductase